MNIFDSSNPIDAGFLQKLDRSYEPNSDRAQKVAAIIQSVRTRGDAALIEFAEKFDGVILSPAELRVSQDEIDAAWKAAPQRTKAALRDAHSNVKTFAQKGLRRNWTTKNSHGGIVGERFDPFHRVGIYVPAGTAPLASTVIMTVTFARAAGVPEIVVVSPPNKSAGTDPTVLAALKLAGATEVFRTGGAHAVAALAYGTESIAPVDKIFGPGNSWVVEAKRQVFGRVAVDLLPGPSEVAVIADGTANAAWVASDLLAQAEHGGESQAILLTPSTRVLKAVAAEIKKQCAKLSRVVQLEESLQSGCLLVKVASIAEAVQWTNRYAPEHVSLQTRDPAKVAAGITTAGAIFMGPFSPVAVGDFTAGPSHELPTGGAGKSFAGLTTDQFQRRTSIVRYTQSALAKAITTVETFSELEGLDAHGRSCRIRLE